MCSLSWREPKLAQRPLVATVNVLGPFKVDSRPLTLRPKDTKPPATEGAARAPVARWKLDETQGAAAADAASSTHRGQVQGRPRWIAAQGQARAALDLDGASSYVDCGDAADFDFRNALTVSLWVNPRELKKSGQTFAAKGNDTWSLRSEGKTGKVVFALDGPQTTGKDRAKATRARSRRPLDDGHWHHVAGVYDGQRIALYVDGELEESVTASGTVALNTEPVWLGNNSAARDAYFNGALADVRLYGCGLTEAEIKALHLETRR
jgi:hypothetical protein